MYGKQADINLHKSCPDQRQLLYDTYEIVSELGTGGCGAVYKAWHSRLKKYIVIKQLSGNSERMLEAHRNEVEALKNVKSLYIPQVYDFLIENRSSSFTVMEYIDGINLDKILAQGRVFSAVEVLKAYCCLAAALQTLHGNDVCHRDIKPSNIIYKQSGEAYLIDFNSALVSGNNTRTVSRSMGYASPEQAAYFEMCADAYYRRSGHVRVGETAGAESENDKNAAIQKVDWKLSDIYSLGAAMYHMLTGKHPPAQPGAKIKIQATGKDEKAAASIIRRSMQSKPEKRYQSAKELYTALNKVKS